LSGRRPLDSALDTYEKRRNAAAVPIYELTTRLALFAPPVTAQAARMRSLRGNQAQTNRFFGVITASIPMAESSRHPTSCAY
jgi:hypothetical protein